MDKILFQFCHIHKAHSSIANQREDAAFSSKLENSTQIQFDIQVTNFTTLDSTRISGDGYAAAISLFIKRGITIISCQFQNISESQVISFYSLDYFSEDFSIKECIFNNIENLYLPLFYIVGTKELQFTNVRIDDNVTAVLFNNVISSITGTNKNLTFWATFMTPEECQILIYSATPTPCTLR